MRNFVSTQIVGIDILRFLAAGLVCAFHFTYWGNVPGSTTAEALQHAAAYPAIDWFTRSGWVGVEIFFVISGFVIAYTAAGKTGVEFFRSRFLRLVPGAWICATITLAVVLLTGLFTPSMAAKGYLHSVAFIPFGPWIDGVYWTLGVEAVFYAVVWLLLLSNRFRYFEPLIHVIGVVSLIAAAACLLHPSEAYFRHAFELLLVRHGSSFALGGMLWLIFFDRFTLARLGGALLFCIASTMETGLTSGGNHGVPSISISLFVTGVVIIAASIAMNARILAQLPEQGRRLVRALGLATYPFYLLHNLIGTTLIRVLVGCSWGPWQALFGAVVVVLALSLLICLKIEPALRSALDGVFKRRLPAAP